MTTYTANNIKCELVEKEIINVDLVEKEILEVKLYSIDTIFKTDETSIDLFVYNETPTEITSTKFRTGNNYRTGKLMVFFNTAKLHSADWSEDSANTFTISIPKISTDKIEASYIKSA